MAYLLLQAGGKLVLQSATGDLLLQASGTATAAAVRFLRTLWRADTTPHSRWRADIAPRTLWRADTTPHSRWRADIAPRAQWRADTSRTAKWGQDVAVQTDLSMYQGEDVTLTLYPASPGGPITGWTLTFAVKSAPGGTVEFSVTPTISDGANGIISVTIPSADTSSLAAGVYWFELRRTDSGAVTELAVGNLTVSAR